jgi:thioredoxin-dependent peroxiredoxin
MLRKLVTSLLSLCCVSAVVAQEENFVAKPYPVPAVSAPDQDGKTVTFPDVAAKGITVLFFYPKALTPG